MAIDPVKTDDDTSEVLKKILSSLKEGPRKVKETVKELELQKHSGGREILDRAIKDGMIEIDKEVLRIGEFGSAVLGKMGG